MIILVLPSLMFSSLVLLSFAGSLDVSKSISQLSPNHSEKLLKCCLANIVVGARTATCLPLLTMLEAIKAATIVFPEPTSPCNSLNMGEPEAISL